MSEPANLDDLVAAVAGLQASNLVLTDAVVEAMGGEVASAAPHAAGTLGATYTLPLNLYRSIEASVAVDVTMMLPTGALGDRSSVLFTSIAEVPVTVTLPTLNWVSPYGQIWDGVIAPGGAARLYFVRSSLGWECVDAVISTTAIPVVALAEEVTVDQSGLQRISGSDAQTVLESADSAIDALYDDLYSDITDAGNKTGAWALSFAATRAVKAIQTGATTITLTPPTAPKIVLLDLDPGGFSTTFATSIKWARATLPDLPTTAGTEITYLLRWTGTQWRGDAEYYGVPA